MLPTSPIETPTFFLDDLYKVWRPAIGPGAQMTNLQNISQIAETSEYPLRNQENRLTCLEAVIAPLSQTFTALDWPIGPVLIRPFAII